MPVNIYKLKALTGWSIILCNYRIILMKPWCCLLFCLNPADVYNSYEMLTVDTSLPMLVKAWYYVCWWLFCTWQSVKYYEGSRRYEFRYFFSWFNYSAMKSFGRFGIEFSTGRISDMRLQISAIGKCISGNQKSQNAFSKGKIWELEFTEQNCYWNYFHNVQKYN